MKKIISLLLVILLIGCPWAGADNASTSTSVSEKVYFAAKDYIINIVDYCHVEKNAFEGEGFYNDAAYCLLAAYMIINGSEETDLVYEVSIGEFAASEDDEGVMFALPMENSFFIMRVSFDTYIVEIYEYEKDPEKYSDEEILRLIAYENGYSGFSCRKITKDVVDYTFND